jgi:hypothetical protein
MHRLKTFAVHYDDLQDRVLVRVNAGTDDACSFWLTRRLALKVVEQGMQFLRKSSVAAKRTPSAHRDELLDMEHQFALAATVKNISKTPQGALNKVAAELATNFVIERGTRHFRLTLRGENEAEAVGVCSPQETQRIIHMLEQAVKKAGWRPDAAAAAAAAAATALLRSVPRPRRTH